MALLRNCLIAFLVLAQLAQALGVKECVQITLRSTGKKPDGQVVRDDNGNPQKIVSVFVWDQISTIKCVPWVNYFYNGRYIIAKNGCQATFKVCFEVDAPTTPAPLTTLRPGCQKVRLLSRKARPVNETLDSEVTEMNLLQDLHDKVLCRRNVNFFFQGATVFANGGCRGDFEVCTTGIGALTTPGPGDIKCKTVELKSTPGREARQELRDAAGNPVDIESATVIRLLSKGKCIEWVTYFTKRSYLIVKNGCYARFRICYRVPFVTTAAPLTTPDPIQCRRYRILKPTRKIVRDNNGLPVPVSSFDVIKDFSKGFCRRGVTYTFEGPLISVRGRCKGYFRVCYGVIPTTPAPLTTEPPTPECRKITIRSTVNQPGRKDVTDRSGNPVTIIHVHVWDQISRTKCIEWVNYFVYDTYIVVKKGCYATFKVCYTVSTQTTPAALTTPLTPSPGCDLVKLMSRKKRPAFVSYDGANIISMTLVREYGKEDCIRGRSYGFKSSRAYARRGCRGLFEICLESTAALTTPSPVKCKTFQVLKPYRRVITNSNGLPADISTIVLDREISQRGICRRGFNYRFQGSVVIINGGCKGVFTVCYNDIITTPAPLTTTPAGPVCKKIDVRSTLTRPGRVNIRDSNGNSVKIVHVHVWDQISKIKCIEWVNYFVYDSYIVAKKGCYATFKVCYVPAVEPTTPAPFTTAAPEVCRRPFTVLKPIRRTIRDDNGDPATITQFTLLREISRNVCRRGVNYFRRGSAIVVNGGCKGVFRVCIENAPPAALTTTPSGPVCKKVNARSTLTRPGRVNIRDANGNPVNIVHVHVWDQISKTKCVEWINYFVRDSYIVVKSGCYATFKVCYTPVEPTTPAALTTTPLPPKCKKYVILKHTRKTIRNNNGQAATITKFQLKLDFSKGVCRKGVNYFFRGSRFVVTKGCKGIFWVCYENPPVTAAPLTTVAPVKNCEKITVRSTRNQPARRDVFDINFNPVHIIHVHVWDQISKTKCIPWVNFFYADSYIIAKKGCQATFKVCYESVPTTPAPFTTAPPVKCKTHQVLFPTAKTITGTNGQPAVITDVILIREISRGVCRQGVNYFSRGATFIVKAGCKGIFKICYVDAPIAPTPPAPLTTTPSTPVTNCKKITIKSTFTQDARKDITDVNGNPVHIFHVHVWDQISAIKCVEWVNFFYYDSYVVVKKGCHATFKVCYKRGQLPPTTPAPLTTTADPTKCRNVTLTGPATRQFLDSQKQPAIITDYRIVRIFAHSYCVKGKTVRVVGNEVQVDSGCIAVIEVCYLPAARPTTPAPLTTAGNERCRFKTLVAPASSQFHDVNGDIGQITSVRLVKNVANGHCKPGVNFDYDDTTLTASGICKGVFEVCVVPATTPAPLTTTQGSPPGKTFECTTENLDGRGAIPDSKVIASTSGRPIVIKSIVLKVEFSNHVCQEWVNFFASGNTAIAKNGCYGKFKICFAVL